MVNSYSYFHLFRRKSLPTNDLELTDPHLYYTTETLERYIHDSIWASIIEMGGGGTRIQISEKLQDIGSVRSVTPVSSSLRTTGLTQVSLY